MIRAVIDTNVLVSSTLSPDGNPAKIMNKISDKQTQLLYSPAILDEYKRVLGYEKLNIAQKTQEKIIAKIEELGVLVEPKVSDVPMIDETDRVFYDAAKESGASLVTGNTKHYPTEDFIMTPNSFLELLNSAETEF